MRKFPLPIIRSLLLVAFSAGVLPAGHAAPASSGIPGYVVLPLSLMDNANQAAVRVALNGQKTMLVLDTGASTTYLDEHFYKRTRSGMTTAKPADLPPEMLNRKASANGQAAEIGYIDSIKAGDADFGKGPVLVTDLSAVFGRYNAYHGAEAIGGLLGEDFLHKYAAIIDWARRGVYLNVAPSRRMKPGPALVAAGWTAVPMAPTNVHHFAVQATVGGKPVRLIVDTGAQFTAFAPDVVPLAMMYNRDTGGSIGHLASYSGTMSMVGSSTTMHIARAEHWKIGNYEIASAVVVVQDFPRGLQEEQCAGEGPILGLIGSEILAKNHAIIDIVGSTLYLKTK